MKSYDLICVVGPTASGKSELAVDLAKKFNGEIVSADSRQIYRGMNIGSGKVEGKWKNGKFIYKTIPHYLVDEASPKSQYSMARFQKNAQKVITDILKRGKTPIVCGGTGYWIDAIAFGKALPEVKPNSKLRATLLTNTTTKNFKLLQKLDPARASQIDPKNPHRLIRALEIVMTTGKPVPKIELTSNFKILWLGLNPDMETLEKNIAKRLSSRLKQGMVKEVSNLHKQGLSWKKLESFGLEYKFCALYLQDKISEEEMEKNILVASRQYAKRQLTWWKRNHSIHWEKQPAKLLALAKKVIS